jgi:CysZ protein
MRQSLTGFGFLIGISYPLRSLKLIIGNTNLWAYLIIPILVNLILGILLYAGLLIFAWNLIQDLLLTLTNWFDQLISNLPNWLSFLGYLAIGIGWLLRFFLVVGLLLITGLLLVQFGVILGAPWYGKLSEQLEKLRTGKIEIVEVGVFQDIGRAILFEIKKIVLTLIVIIPLLLLNFIPGIGTVASTIGGIALTGTIVCLDFFDSPLERRRLKFRQKLGIVWRSLPASAGFGLVCLGLISIPFVNLITIPLCVASGTLFVCDRILPKLIVDISQ